MTNYHERNFDPWTLRAVRVDAEDYREFAADFGLVAYNQDQGDVWIWFAARLGIDEWFCVAVTTAGSPEPGIESAYSIYDSIDGSELDVFLSYMGAKWKDLDDGGEPAAFFASIHRQFAATSDHQHRQELMRLSKSELEAKRAGEEIVTKAEFDQKMREASPAVKIVLVNAEGDDDIMGVYRQGVVMQGPDALLDVASSRVILRRHALHGWYVPDAVTQPAPLASLDFYMQFFIQGADVDFDD